jgi:hypothetical protein
MNQRENGLETNGYAERIRVKGKNRNTYIDNPHYFAETHFDLHKLLAILPVPVTEIPQTHPSTYQRRKENRTDTWHSRNGTGK